MQQGGGLLVFGNRRLRPGAYRSHDVLSYQNFGSLFTMVNPDEPLENLSYYRPLGQWLPETNGLERVLYNLTTRGAPKPIFKNSQKNNKNDLEDSYNQLDVSMGTLYTHLLRPNVPFV